MQVDFVVIALLAALSSANGANDVSKGVATLVGSGVARYRTAILWGAVSTLAGSLLSGILAARMLLLFTGGIVLARPTPAFSLAVTCGAAGCVFLATFTYVDNPCLIRRDSRDRWRSSGTAKPAYHARPHISLDGDAACGGTDCWSELRDRSQDPVKTTEGAKPNRASLLTMDD